LVVSANDLELVPYAAARDAFAADGTYVAIMAEEAARVGRDKHETHAWLSARGYPVSRRLPPEALAGEGPLPFPVIGKPARGSAAIGVSRVHERAELRSALDAVEDPVIEEMETGREFTVNVLAAEDGRFVCAVPHVRLEVRAGEVSKGRTFRHD